MVIAEVRVYSANIQVGDWAMGGTLAAHEIGCQVKTGCPVKTRMLGDGKTRMLDDGPKGGYRQKNDERMYTTVYGGVLGEEALHYL